MPPRSHHCLALPLLFNRSVPGLSKPRVVPVLLALLCLMGAACGDSGPSLDPLHNTVAAVGSELVIEIKASNKSGRDIRFSYDTNATIDSDRGRLTQRPGGSAIFTWTPSSQDIGAWTFDFHAVDSSGKSTETINIEVRSAIGRDALPVFRRPLGAGTALDLSRSDCVEIDFLVEDRDSLEVVLSQDAPTIVGATLDQESDLEATWKWCPSKAQRAAQDRYMLTVGANDGVNAVAQKHYQIILRDEPRAECPGEAPTIRHAAKDAETLGNIPLVTKISDDRGLKGSVSLYYSSQAPSDPPDLGAMTLLPMELDSGSTQEGTWTVSIPNPVVNSPAGTTQALHYVIVADDNDDKGGNCDHSTVTAYSMNVTNPGGSGELGLCEPCVADLQCGGAKDLCLPLGTESESFCFQSCDDTECSTGFTCSERQLESIDGTSGRQCIPDSQTCTESLCIDDGLEQNDGITQSAVLLPGQLDDLRLCPLKTYAADEDWYEITIEEDSEITLAIDGIEDPNMDMRLLDADGVLLAVSEDFGSSDSISRCLPAGTYYLRLYSYLFYKSYIGGELQDMGNDYSLTYTTTASQCSANPSCNDDAFEDDDNVAQARIPDFGGLSSADWYSMGNQICAGDQDWYHISAYNNLNKLSVSVAFEQSNAQEDLDILLYDGDGRLITSCTEGNTDGCTTNGQSRDSSEHLVFVPPTECSLPISCEGCAPCDYYVVVNGFAGAENAYDICIAYDAEERCL